MASVLVVLDRGGDDPSPASRRILGEGRRIASHLGATLYGLALLSDAEAHSDRWITELGRLGADKVVLLTGERFGQTPLWESHGPPIASVLDELSPALVLLTSTPAGRELSPRLAAHMRAALVDDAIVERDADSSLLLHEWSPTRQSRRTLCASELAAPTVATLSSARLQEAQGEDDADVLFFDSANLSIPCAILERKEYRPAPATDVVVTAGVGALHSLRLVDELASALGATRAVTRSLHELSPRDGELVVDVAHERVCPRLYIACGASGSKEHLGAVGAGTAIVALGDDPRAPLLRAADYALLGDLQELLPGFVEAARKGLG